MTQFALQYPYLVLGMFTILCWTLFMITAELCSRRRGPHGPPGPTGATGPCGATGAPGRDCECKK